MAKSMKKRAASAAVAAVLALSVIGCDERPPPLGIAKDRIVRSTDVELRVKITGEYDVSVNQTFDQAAIVQGPLILFPQAEDIGRVSPSHWPTVSGVHRVGEKDYVVTCDGSLVNGPPARSWALIRGATADIEYFHTRDALLDRLEELSIGMKSLERVYGNQLY